MWVDYLATNRCELGGSGTSYIVICTWNLLFKSWRLYITVLLLLAHPSWTCISMAPIFESWKWNMLIKSFKTRLVGIHVSHPWRKSSTKPGPLAVLPLYCLCYGESHRICFISTTPFLVSPIVGKFGNCHFVTWHYTIDLKSGLNRGFWWCWTVSRCNQKDQSKAWLPQDGILSSSLWNIVIDDLLNYSVNLIPDYLQAFADDLITLAQRDDTDIIW